MDISQCEIIQRGDGKRYLQLPGGKEVEDKIARRSASYYLILEAVEQRERRKDLAFSLQVRPS